MEVIELSSEDEKKDMKVKIKDIKKKEKVKIEDSKINKKKLKTIRKDPAQLSMKNFISGNIQNYFSTTKESSLPAQVS